MFGGCPKFELGEADSKQPKIAETTVLQLGKCTICDVNINNKFVFINCPIDLLQLTFPYPLVLIYAAVATNLQVSSRTWDIYGFSTAGYIVHIFA